MQYPTKENGMEGICKAIVESQDGESSRKIGDANPKNVNKQIAEHVLRMAATRAKARALRDFTNIGMTCLEELGDLDSVIGAASPKPKGKKRAAKKQPPKTENQTPKNKKSHLFEVSGSTQDQCCSENRYPQPWVGAVVSTLMKLKEWSKKPLALN
jgi:hypothetical protein